jgi:polyhydroxybutyrate depolymerase
MGMVNGLEKIWVFFALLVATVVAFADHDSVTAKNSREFKIKIGAIDRTYLLHVPPQAAPPLGYPLVFLLHGGGAGATGADSVSHLSVIADRENFLLVMPQGFGKVLADKTLGTWNAGNCCGAAMEQNIDDVKFISMLIDKLESDFNVNHKQVYVSGISNGGMMAYRLACELSDKIAAISAVAAVGMFKQCDLKNPVPTIHFHGTADTCVPYAGGPGGGCLEKVVGRLGHRPFPEAHWTSPSVVKFIGEWREKNQLPGGSKTSLDKGNAHCETFGPDKKNTEVTFCTLKNGGHTWPGGEYGAACDEPSTRTCTSFKEAVGPISLDLNASQMMWDFFKMHPKI